jgi:hypothetical protein
MKLSGKQLLVNNATVKPAQKNEIPVKALPSTTHKGANTRAVIAQNSQGTKDNSLSQKRTRAQDRDSQSSVKRGERSQEIADNSIAETRNAKKVKKLEASTVAQTRSSAANLRPRASD